MATKAPKRAAQTGRSKSDGAHEGFLRHKRYRWLNIAALISLLVIAGYLLVDVQPRHNGGSWYGYTLGIIGTLLILWLTMLGLRKRIPSRKRWSLKGWTSAHVYLGLALIVIGTLHTGFQFGWNVHTLAYVLMMVVIVSGIFGITAYSILPRSMSANRQELTENQMIEGLRAMDRQLNDAAQPLEFRYSELVRASLKENPFGGGLIVRLFGISRRSPARIAIDRLYRQEGDSATGDDHPLNRIESLLEKKEAKVARMRRHLRYKALLEIWLYIHVPLTFALIAALAAHVISVFFYW